MNVGQFIHLSSNVTSEEVVSSDFIGGDGVAIAVGPAIMPSDSLIDLKVIALLQSADISSGKNITQIGELGTDSKYLTSRRGIKALRAARMVTEDTNALKAFYSWEITANPGISHPGGNIWKNLDHSLFKRPIGLLLIYYTGEASNRTIIGSAYLENALFEDIGDVAREGEMGVIENFQFKWGDTKYPPMNTLISP